MPFITSSSKIDFDAVVLSLIEKGLIKKTGKENVYTSQLANGIKLKMERWFQFAPDLDVRLNTPVADEGLWHQAQYALSVNVEIPESAGKYVPATVKENVVNYLFSKMPTLQQESAWWHLLVSQGTSFIFLHDISEPRQITVDAPATFINVGSELEPELRHCSLQGIEFKVKPNPENEQSIWVHETSAVEIIQLFEQSLNPTETYHYQRIQLHQLSAFNNYGFRAVRNIDTTEAIRIRRILDPEWTALKHNYDALIWCFPPDTSPTKIERIEKKLQVLGLKVLHVDEDIKKEILANISKDLPPVSLVTITDLSDVSVPVDLLRRGFWMYKKLKLKRKMDEHGAMELLKYKFAFENGQGYDHMNGKTTLHSHTSELPNILMDLFTVRCNQMIDIAILQNPVTVNFRIFDNSCDDSSALALKGIKRFEKIYRDIVRILKVYISE